MNRLTFLLTFLSLGVSGPSTSAQDPDRPPARPFGWDLSYASLFEKNGIGPEHPLRTWLKKSRGDKGRAVLEKVLADRQDERIVSDVMIEAATTDGPHYGCLLLTIKPDSASTVMIGLRDPFDVGLERTIDLRKEKGFEMLLQEVLSWKQSKPEGSDRFDGFLNLYHHGKSQQFLLTIDDIGDDVKESRIQALFEPFFRQ